MFPTLQITLDNLESSWAGLRPLIAEDGRKPGEISRKDEIFISDSGLISMAGGKLTGYRKMAEQAVDTVTNQLKDDLGILYSKSETKHLPISGGDVGGSKGFEQYKKEKAKEGVMLGLEYEEATKLIQKYGTNVDKVFELYETRKEEAKLENIDPIVFAQLHYALEYELAYRPTDFFIRRTGALFFDIAWVKEHKEKVIAYMNKILNWKPQHQAEFESELENLLEEAVFPVE